MQGQVIEGDFEEVEGEVQPAMTDSELVSICMTEVDQGIGGLEADDQDITTPLDYYWGRLPGITKAKAKDPNASRFVSQDVMDGVEATVSEIMPTFTTETIAFYEPNSERDEDQARMETDLVNYLFFEEYDGHTLLQVALKDALLNKNCTVKAYWDERAQVEYETYEDVPEMALAQILQPRGEDETVEVVEQEITKEADTEMADMISIATQVDPEAASQAIQDPNAQMEVQQAMLDSQCHYTIKIKRIKIVGKPVIESVPPENVIVNSDHDSPYLYNARFVAHEAIETESSLIEQGFDPEIVKELPSYTGQLETAARRSPTDTDNLNYDSAHHSTRNIKVYECYPLVDFDGDGIAERRKVVISNDHLLSNDECKSVPMIGGVATVVPHAYRGVSLYERLKGIQDSKTPVVRSVIDGTQLSSNPRIGVITGEVNIDDLLTSRTGGAVRASSRDSVFELPNPQVPQSSYSMLSYMDNIRSERGGSAIDTSSQAQAISGDTAHGIERVMSAMELNNALVSRSIGETLIRGIFIQLHDLIRNNYIGEVSARVGGKWLTSMPSEWVERTNVSVQIGSSHAERARQGQVMEKVIGLQRKLASIGSTMFDEEKAYSAITDAVNLGGVKNPERYFVDPSSKEGKAKNQQKAKQDAQMKQKQDMAEASLAKANMDMAKAELMKGQADLMANRVKLALQSQKQRTDAVINSLKAQLQKAKQQSEDFKDGANLAFDYEELYANIALELTKLELQSGEDLTTDYYGNLQ